MCYQYSGRYFTAILSFKNSVALLLFVGYSQVQPAAAILAHHASVEKKLITTDPFHYFLGFLWNFPLNCGKRIAVLK
jgi:hypothetical protein